MGMAFKGELMPKGACLIMYNPKLGSMTGKFRFHC